MENSSILSLSQETGRISTRWSRPSKPRNNFGTLGRDAALRRPLHGLVPPPKFHFFRRVKGAWWPSRSSKPLSVRYSPGRGRFDSYPLRLLIFDFRFSILDSWTSPNSVPAAVRALSVGEAASFPLGRGGDS